MPFSIAPRRLLCDRQGLGTADLATAITDQFRHTQGLHGGQAGVQAHGSQIGDLIQGALIQHGGQTFVTAVV